MKRIFEFNSELLTNILGEEYRNIYKTTIFSVSTLNNPKSSTLIFAKKLDEVAIKKLKAIEGAIILINKKYSNLIFDNNCVVYVERPRKEYSRILNFILDNKEKENRKYTLNEKGYYVGENVVIGENAVIEPLVFIDHDVQIGANCIVKSGAKIRMNSTIGNKCIIKENAVIGIDGFGFERDEDGTAYRIPHFGGVIIKDNVEIGSCTSVAQGTIEPTVIEEYVKIDDGVVVAHNCHIGKGTIITASSQISGSVNVGKCCWISPGACIINGISIGNNVMIGIGSVVINDIEDNEVTATRPAFILKR